MHGHSKPDAYVDRGVGHGSTGEIEARSRAPMCVRHTRTLIIMPSQCARGPRCCRPRSEATAVTSLQPAARAEGMAGVDEVRVV